MSEQKQYSVDTVQPNGKRDTFFVYARNFHEARALAAQNVEHDGKGEKIVRIYR